MSIAGYLMMLGINFIGLSYLLVYVGAVSILFLFILMLINVRISELVTDNSNSIPLAIMIAVFINVNQLFPRAVGMPVMMVGGFNLLKKNYVDLKGEIQPYIDFDNNYVYVGHDLNDLFFVTSHSWDLRLAETFHITIIGNIIYTNYPLWLILTSIILLLAMIGSIVITLNKAKVSSFSYTDDFTFQLKSSTMNKIYTNVTNLFNRLYNLYKNVKSVLVMW